VTSRPLQVQVDGKPASAADLAPALVNYGHFTTMQVRAGRVRGLRLHLDRLAAATEELFGSDLDVEDVRAQLRRAVAGVKACTARVTIFPRELPLEDLTAPMVPRTMVALRAPSPPATVPVRLASYRHERPAAHIKHVGTFPLFHYARQARLAGFDDALFVTAEGLVSEASIWNAGFFDGTAVVWPEAPKLSGTTMRLLDAGLHELGVPTTTRPVRLDDLGDLRSAFLCHSATPGCPVSAVDSRELHVDDALTALLARAHDLAPWDEI
jgi:branched-subunit amino acid aminotransferase/4-amino-4-deoxychorismate lyase